MFPAIAAQGEEVQVDRQVKKALIVVALLATAGTAQAQTLEGTFSGNGAGKVTVLMVEDGTPDEVVDQHEVTFKGDSMVYRTNFLNSVGETVVIYQTGHWWEVDQALFGECYQVEGRSVQIGATLIDYYPRTLELACFHPDLNDPDRLIASNLELRRTK